MSSERQYLTIPIQNRTGIVYPSDVSFSVVFCHWFFRNFFLLFTGVFNTLYARKEVFVYLLFHLEYITIYNESETENLRS